MLEPSPELHVMIRAAHQAGEALREDALRVGSLDVREKAASDFVSSADLRSQALISSVLGGAFPDHGLLLEEGEPAAGAQPSRSSFIVDPLDGTTNFLHGIPHFAVAIALERDNEVVAGVVFDVAKRELFVTEKGAGAWLGNTRLRLAKARAGEMCTLSNAVVGTGIPHRGGFDHEKYLRALANVMRDVAGIRRGGSAALDLAYVAAGRFDAFFELGLAPWDVAAGALLVREAGGVVTNSRGEPMTLRGRDILAARAGLHSAMVERLRPLHT